MGTSIINLQRDLFLEAVRYTGGREWKVLVLDENSHKLVDNVVKQDDILNENVTNIEKIEERRPMNKDMDAVYLLSPLPHIVDCLLADFDRRRYRRAFILWTALLDPALRGKIDGSPSAREQIADFRTLNVDYFPRESHVTVFRDPWSFPVLFHPACSNLIRRHLESLSQKIVSICVSLGEYPTVRYYRPPNPSHEASVLCSHLARFVSDELEQYARYHQDFPPPSPRPRGVLFVVDRSMDLYSPLVHEFTYQAMAMDLLPIIDGDKVVYKPSAGQSPEGIDEEKRKNGMELEEKDKIWVENRHMHMKDLLTKLVADFNKFRADNPQFAESTEGQTTSVNTIKDMLAGLPQFQQGKEAFSLHLNMAEECMKIFQEHKLLDIGSVEQSLATGLDEEYKKPKNLADQVVRLLDDDSVQPPDRLRLIILYLLYRDGLLKEDIQKLLAHAHLPSQDAEMIYNLDLLGARVEKPLKDTKPPPQPLFPPKVPTAQTMNEEISLSRFDPALRSMLEEQARGTLDQSVFPFARPDLDSANGLMGHDNVSQASLRSAGRPTWARTRPAAHEPRQRIIVFMAGGATYAEARACYEVSQASAKDIFLVTSHMVTPGLFLRQLSDLSADKRRLDIPSERPKPKAPAHLFERQPQPSPPAQQSSNAPSKAVKAPPPPTAGLANMTISSKHPSSNGAPAPPPPSGPDGKLHKKDKEKEEKKKKHHFFR